MASIKGAGNIKRAILKETLLRAKQERKAQQAMGIAPKRPLAKLAAAEERVKQGSSSSHALPQLSWRQRVLSAGKRFASHPVTQKTVQAGAYGMGAGIGAGSAITGNASARFRNKSEPSAAIGWLFFFLSIALYASDIFITRFNGIDIKFFSQLTAPDWLYKSGFLTLFLIIFCFQFILSRPKDKQELLSFIFLDITLSIILIASGYSFGTLLHTFFAFMVWVALINKTAETKAGSYNTLTVLLLIDFVGFSALEYMFANIGYLEAASFIANRLLFPFYTLYLLGYLGIYVHSTFAAIILFILLSTYIVGAIKETPRFQNAMAQISEQQEEEAISWSKAALERFREVIALIVDPAACAMKGLPLGSSEYDSCLKTRLYIRHPELKEENIEGQTDRTKIPTKVSFSVPENFPSKIRKELPPISFPMQLEISTPQQITIIPSCKFKKGKEEFAGTAKPDKEYPLVIQPSIKKTEVILCKPDENMKYDLGSYSVVFEAEITDLETNFTATRLFIGDANPQKIKIADYALSSSEPPKGPDDFAAFAVAVGAEKDPFLDSKQKQSLVGSLSNRLKKGTIQEVKSIKITLPEGISASTDCQRDFTYSRDLMTLNQEIIEKININTTEDKKYYLGCPVTISENLQKPGLDFQKRSISSTIEYSYKITTSQSFEVS